MGPERQTQSIQEKTRDALAIRFPLPCDAAAAREERRFRLRDFLPRRWRRWVVIQGHHFWLPG